MNKPCRELTFVKTPVWYNHHPHRFLIWGQSHWFPVWRTFWLSIASSFIVWQICSWLSTLFSFRASQFHSGVYGPTAIAKTSRPKRSRLASFYRLGSSHSRRCWIDVTFVSPCPRSFWIQTLWSNQWQQLLVSDTLAEKAKGMTEVSS